MANVSLGTIRDYLKGVYDAVALGDAAKKTTGLQIAGTDGTNARIIRTNANGEVLTQLSGSKMELYGASLDDRPAATTVPIGATFTIVDASQEFRSWMSNGTNWGEEI